jgi:hypothetical protein
MNKKINKKTKLVLNKLEDYFHINLSIIFAVLIAIIILGVLRSWDIAVIVLSIATALWLGLVDKNQEKRAYLIAKHWGIINQLLIIGRFNRIMLEKLNKYLENPKKYKHTFISIEFYLLEQITDITVDPIIISTLNRMQTSKHISSDKARSDYIVSTLNVQTHIYQIKQIIKDIEIAVADLENPEILPQELKEQVYNLKFNCAKLLSVVYNLRATYLYIVKPFTSKEDYTLYVYRSEQFWKLLPEEISSLLAGDSVDVSL